jgi:hypothetical protein
VAEAVSRTFDPLPMTHRVTPARLGSYYGFVIAAWVVTWLTYEAAGLAALSEGLRVAFWTTAKLIVWIAPIVAILRWASIERPADYLGFTNARRGAVVGLAIGAAFVAVSRRSTCSFGRSRGPRSRRAWSAR